VYSDTPPEEQITGGQIPPVRILTVGSLTVLRLCLLLVAVLILVLILVVVLVLIVVLIVVLVLVVVLIAVLVLILHGMLPFFFRPGGIYTAATEVLPRATVTVLTQKG